MTYRSSLRSGAALLLAVLALSGPRPGYADGKTLPLTPGGLSPKPIITSVTSTNHQDLVEWLGFGGPFQVQRQTSIGGPWVTVADTFATSATVASVNDLGFYRILTPSPRFAGASTCLICHTNFTPEVGNWVHTAHAHALDTLKRIGMGNNSGCLPCHTVGYGLPTGFISEAQTPRLAGVQCENCHGPAGDHASAPYSNPTPVASPAAEICGGCHTDAHHPTYDEWAESGHHEVIEDAVSATVAPSRLKTCGACHSGSVRLAMLKSYDKNLPIDALLPVGEEAVMPITCAVCHDPHQPTATEGQLRNPRSSTNFFSYRTSVDFAAQYNPNVQMCGQCHNQRGALWNDTSRPPHHSPQYNMLIGNGGYVQTNSFVPQSFHRKIDNQCAHCHTHPHEAANPTEETPNFTGHNFEPDLRSCEPCHSEAEAGLFMSWTQTEITNRIAQVKSQLDTWAQVKAPSALRTKYGNLAWEYTNEGQLSNPTADPALAGPSATEQSQIPDRIKQARFNLYLVEHDASRGVHNADYARYLLGLAEFLIDAELDAP